MTAWSASRNAEEDRVDRFLADWSLAPRQFRERFLDAEGWERISVPILVAMSIPEFDAMVRRWRVVGALPRVNRRARVTLVGTAPDNDLIEVRPAFYDEGSVAEMMRGMFSE